MKKMKKRLLTLALAGMSALAMTACGSEDAVDTQPEQKEWVYVPEYITLEDMQLYDAVVVGDKLYYQSGSYDEETQQYKRFVGSYSITDRAKAEDVEIKLMESTDSEDGSYTGENLNGFRLLEDGSLALIVNTYRSTMDNYTSENSFRKLDAAGNEVFNLDMSALVGGDDSDVYINNIQVDGQGRFYLIGDESVYLVDADGKPCGKVDVPAESWVNGSGVSKDGKVYICYYAYTAQGGGNVLAEVDFEGKSMPNVYENFDMNGGGSFFYPGVEKDFLIHDGTSVFEYDLATQTKEKLFDWLDCDINGNYVQSVGTCEDGTIFATVQDWERNENNIVLLTKTPGSEVAQKEEILIGTISGSYAITSYAVQFNRNNDKYHISVKQYMDYDNWTENSFNDALTALNNDITSSNPPDVLDLSGLNVVQLAAKGVFEDLTPYLERSTVFSKEDFLENILEANTYDGKLLAIPASFEVQTVIGRPSEVGTEMGWTMAELIAYADEHPQAQIFDTTTQEYMMQLCLTYNGDSFINWEDGSCNFDSQEFKDILEFVSRFPEDYVWSEDDGSEPTKIQNGDVLLSNAYIYNFDEIQLYKEMFGGEVTCIGFPTADGSVGTMLNYSAAYAITSTSDAKDAAWTFIESYLNEFDPIETGWGFPAKKADLEKMREEACKEEYLTDENGEIVTDENGEAIVMNSGNGVGYGDGWSYTYRVPTEEEADQVMEVLKTAKSTSSMDSRILSIINEEAAPFFEGQKSVDEVVKIIQSRVQIFVDENN